eukprot:CAMPEP_0181336268 /NCGR_PEP_ID=MMETSP1101-20121128/27324_1 /TAXON_ID=46948 /ORGANISM="Rhodomonas abbreviata, Strain Caron Lab Isolate" /LENGTH=71 /DNA_ID=CAMNT_0023446543 /DNA_START=171 /DNA_END=382 /DNA_ORIENTATION=+
MTRDQWTAARSATMIRMRQHSSRRLTMLLSPATSEKTASCLTSRGGGMLTLSPSCFWSGSVGLPLPLPLPL